MTFLSNQGLQSQKIFRTGGKAHYIYTYSVYYVVGRMMKNGSVLRGNRRFTTRQVSKQQHSCKQSNIQINAKECGLMSLFWFQKINFCALILCGIVFNVQLRRHCEKYHRFTVAKRNLSYFDFHFLLQKHVGKYLIGFT